jgi:tetratricopeptide (TPR) repeat protein
MAGAGIFYCWQPLVRRRIGPRIFVFTNGVAVVVVVGLGGLTWNQAQVWHDTDRLWKHVLSAAGESKIAHNNLGRAMVKRGELGEAIKHYRQALRINPAYAQAQNDLGVALLKEGKLTEATEHFCQALRLGYPLAEKNLKVALARLGKRKDTVRSCREAQRNM